MVSACRVPYSVSSRLLPSIARAVEPVAAAIAER